MALRALIYEAGMEALTFAADVLGVEDRSYSLTDRLLTMADTPAALTRVAGAVAMGIAERRMYHGHDSAPCRDYLAALTGAGWDPDTWTAAIIDQQTRRDQADTDEADTEPAEPTDTDPAEQPGEDGAKPAEPTDDEPAPTEPTDDDAKPTDIDPAEPTDDAEPTEPTEDGEPGERPSETDTA